MSERQKATLRNWYLDGDRLYGNAYGHPRFPGIMEGEPVRTSRVLEMGDGWAKTLNTDYTLEGPPRYSQTAPTPNSEARDS